MPSLPIQPDTNKTRSRTVRLLVLALFAGGLLAFFLFDWDRYLSLEVLQASRDQILAQVERHFWTAVLLALLVYTLATALSIPGGLVLSLAMGLIFGRWMGTLVIVVAATLGATLVFLAARHVFGEALRQRLRGRANRLLEGFREDAFNYLLFLRLVPIFPFWLVNIAPAFTGIGLRTYVLTTFIGIIPGSFVFANIGASLGHVTSTEDLLSGETLLAFSLLGLFAILPVGVKRWKRRRTRQSAP